MVYLQWAAGRLVYSGDFVTRDLGLPNIVVERTSLHLSATVFSIASQSHIFMTYEDSARGLVMMHGLNTNLQGYGSWSWHNVTSRFMSAAREVYDTDLQFVTNCLIAYSNSYDGFGSGSMMHCFARNNNASYSGIIGLGITYNDSNFHLDRGSQCS